MDIPSTRTTKNAQETAAVGKELADSLRKKVNGKRKKGGEASKATVICLYGELGSGKTTFVQGFGRRLGITARLLSPTFIIVRRYQIPKSSGFLYHLDLYRVEETDLEELTISDMLSDPDSIVVIEWAEKLGSWLSRNRVDITFSVLPNGSHQIEINPKLKFQMSNQTQSSKFK